jgi:hypothetical protein
MRGLLRSIFADKLVPVDGANGRFIGIFFATPWALFERADVCARGRGDWWGPDPFYVGCRIAATTQISEKEKPVNGHKKQR